MKTEENKYFKFMTNILTPAKLRGKRISVLEKVTVDCVVPFQRIIFTIGIVALLVVIFFSFLFYDLNRFSFIVIPTIICFITSLIFCYFFLISSRGKSMLSSIYDLLVFYVFSYFTHGCTINTLGIKKTKKGVLLFDDGNVGLIFKVVGLGSKSMLSSTINMVCEAKSSWLIERSPTSQEIFIVGVERLDCSTQLANLQVLGSRENTNLEDVWCNYMTQLDFEYIVANIHLKDFYIRQYLIIKEESINKLKNYGKRVVWAAENGLYSKVQRVVEDDEVEEIFGSYILHSNRKI